MEILQGIRFMLANPLIAHPLTARRGGDRIGANLVTFAEELTRLLPDPTPENVVLLRMAVLSINAAVQAAAQPDPPDEVIVGAARRAATALLAEIVAATDEASRRSVPSVLPGDLSRSTVHSVSRVVGQCCRVMA